MRSTLKTTKAWAAVGKKSGKLLRNLRGRYAVYYFKEDAEQDCPTYGVVRLVSVRVIDTNQERE